MFDRPRAGARALLVQCDLRFRAEQSELDELQHLLLAAGGEALGWVRTLRQDPDPRFFLGSGKVDELSASVQEHAADLVVFNHALTPAQERNLERAIHCRVLDRTGLILDIFAQRARSYEGKLQVELAQLRHLSTRLVRGWTHLERQKGGIGLRGPGETQLETDRRLLGKRLIYLQNRLAAVAAQRDRSRRARKKAEVPVVSLVGYTNAGKSTLFNSITAAQVYAQDQLFATLDPTIRRLGFTQGFDAVMVDTVGFISNLPHELVTAFHSTLEETSQADLLLHVIDGADPRHQHYRDEVNRVLAQIGADQVPQIEVWNKLDQAPDRRSAPHAGDADQGIAARIWVSALTGEGLDDLRELIVDRLGAGLRERHFDLGMAQGALRAALYQRGQVLSEEFREQRWMMRVRISDGDYQVLKKRFFAYVPDDQKTID